MFCDALTRYMCKHAAPCSPATRGSAAQCPSSSSRCSQRRQAARPCAFQTSEVPFDQCCSVRLHVFCAPGMLSHLATWACPCAWPVSLCPLP